MTLLLFGIETSLEFHVNLITIAALSRYTLETQGMRREMLKETEIQLRPVVVSRYGRHDFGPGVVDCFC